MIDTVKAYVVSNFASKLVLGSANFGLNYGLSNKGGRINHAELDKILTQANSMGINIIDTAQAMVIVRQGLFTE